jgi:Zn-dependent peptidase ImmA (M78 family)
MDRKTLVRQGIQAAADLRNRLDFDPFGPVDPYRAAQLLGVKVVFLGNSMEGFYFKTRPPKILLSSLRPVPRRAFTCAHELGHHVFGHGSTIDQLQEDGRSDSDKPDEILANAFAAFFLMPSVGLRGAFARRGWICESATPLQAYTIACQFGVGYRTLINHLSYTLRDMSAARRKELERSTPQRIRRELLDQEYDSFVTVDQHNEAPHFDVEHGAAAILPLECKVTGAALSHVRSLDTSHVFEAARRGRVQVSGTHTPFEIRVMPKAYEGAALNRFLEDPDED